MQAITATIIGVLGTGFVSVFLYSMRMMSARFDRIDDRFDRVDDRFDRVDDRFDRFEDKFTSQISGVHGRIDGLRSEFHLELGGIREEMHKGFKEHGERLARIEAHLEIDPPAEAA